MKLSKNDQITYDLMQDVVTTLRKVAAWEKHRGIISFSYPDLEEIADELSKNFGNEKRYFYEDYKSASKIDDRMFSYSEFCKNYKENS